LLRRVRGIIKKEVRMPETSSTTERFLHWVRERYDERTYILLTERLDREPKLEPHVALKTILQEERGGNVSTRIEQLYFCSD
jgi:hypothetical protein